MVYYYLWCFSILVNYYFKISFLPDFVRRHNNLKYSDWAPFKLSTGWITLFGSETAVVMMKQSQGEILLLTLNKLLRFINFRKYSDENNCQVKKWV